MKDKETLESRAIVGKESDPVETLVCHRLADGVVTPGVVVSGVLLMGRP